MTIDCPVPKEQLYDYFSGDISGEETDELEDHVFSCELCARAFDSVGALTEALRQQFPLAISRERLERLHAAEVRIRQTPVAPGGPVDVVFGKDVDLLVPTLLADLTTVRRLGVEFGLPDGTPLFTSEDIPFDRERGEVLIACQRHYLDEFPALVRFRLFAMSEDHTETVGEYLVNHVME